jgi:ketosteroid isomerase-like protein
MTRRLPIATRLLTPAENGLRGPGVASGAEVAGNPGAPAGRAGDPGEDTAATLAIVARFNEAFDRHDVDGVMHAMSDDCVFENTAPAPDGTRYVGQEAVRGFWERFFASAPDACFEYEDVFGAGDRAVVRWVYRKQRDGRPWHLRGVDVFTVRHGKIVEKLSYVKG